MACMMLSVWTKKPREIDKGRAADAQRHARLSVRRGPIHTFTNHSVTSFKFWNARLKSHKQIAKTGTTTLAPRYVALQKYRVPDAQNLKTQSSEM